jgi:hypothetical protein
MAGIGPILVLTILAEAADPTPPRSTHALRGVCRLAARRGSKRALIAVAHSLLVSAITSRQKAAFIRSLAATILIICMQKSSNAIW